jgi:hypothetical protein
LWRIDVVLILAQCRAVDEARACDEND